MDTENIPNENLPKPEEVEPEIQKQIKTQSKCPLATPGRKKSTGKVLSAKKTSKKPSTPKTPSDSYRKSIYLDGSLTPVGGDSFFSVLDLNDNTPSKPSIDMETLTKPRPIQKTSIPSKSKSRSSKRVYSTDDDSFKLFKEAEKKSSSSTGIIRVFWLILEWFGALLLSYLSPTPIPESTKSIYKARKKNKNPSDELESDRPFHLGFTPMVRRTRPPL